MTYGIEWDRDDPANPGFTLTCLGETVQLSTRLAHAAKRPERWFFLRADPADGDRGATIVELHGPALILLHQALGELLALDGMSFPKDPRRDD